MRRTRGFGLIVVAGLFLSLLVACGDDDDEGATPTPAATETIVLYFPMTTATGFEFIAAERKVTEAEAEPIEIVGALVAGPTSAEESSLGVINPFPPNVEVLSLDVVDGTATVDFTGELLDYGGGAANVEAIGGSITRTIEEATGATEVVILVEGEADRLQP